MPDYTMKRNDTYPPLTVALSDLAGPIDLTAASAVHMEMKANVGTLIASLGCTIASAAGGVIKRNWGTGGLGETSMADTWSLEWEILWAAGGVQTVPNDGVRQLLIEPDIEAS